MPTANRSDFILKSIACFLNQDYANKELIILDDGTYPVEPLVPKHPQILYTYVCNKAKIGAKRNHACSLSKGTVIMHWDDDDWYAPNWISTQLAAMDKSGADITGLDALVFYQPPTNKAYKYVYPANAKPWVAGATMAYKKSVWQLHPFEDIQIGEDNWFVWNAGVKVIPHQYIKGFVSFIHAANTSPKHVNTQRWQPFSMDEVKDILNNPAVFFK